MKTLLVALLLASSAAAECPIKAPTHNYGEFRCTSSRRISWVEMTYYYGSTSNCVPVMIAIVTREALCDGRVNETCSGVACPPAR